MKQRVEEMEREAKKLRELQAAAESAGSGGGGSDAGVPMETEEDKAASDGRSVFVGNVGCCLDPWCFSELGIFRWTMAQPQKRFRAISKLVEPSIE